jgi:hypothetical protein
MVMGGQRCARAKAEQRLIHNSKVTPFAAHRTLSAWGGLVVILSTLRRRWRGLMQARPARPSIAPMPRQRRGPYSRASWEALLRLGQASLAEPANGRHGANAGGGAPIMSDAMADAESDAFWGRAALGKNRASLRGKPTTQAFRAIPLDVQNRIASIETTPPHPAMAITEVLISTEN